jgi:DNA-directed RNA polymerase subunit RPC12/RpoP
MKDYGATLSCPRCGGKHHITPRQLQADAQVEFVCAQCGQRVVATNDVASKIFAEMDAIKEGLGRIKI